MGDSRVELAALNNALWCDAVCDAQGIPGEFLEDVWLNRRPTPPYYPNLVTLSPGERASAQRSQVERLLESGLAGDWAVKDSFCALDLAPLGFQVAFEAAWLWLAPRPTGDAEATDSAHWTVVQSPEELQRWELAWAGKPANDHSMERIFMPDLLDQSGVVFIAGYQAGEVVAGVIANRTDTVVGLSNVFVPAAAEQRFWRGCVQAAQAIFPGLPLVGYEQGSALADALDLGFEEIGRLRVWTQRVEPR